MFRSSHNDIVDYGLEEIIARTEESLKEEEVKNSDEEMVGPQVVPHPIDLLYFMELKEEEDKGTKQKRRRSKQTKLKPVRIKQTPATGNQYEEDGADGFQSSKDQDEHWPDVYSKAVPGTTQTTRRSLPELPGSGRQMSPPEPAGDRAREEEAAQRATEAAAAAAAAAREQHPGAGTAAERQRNYLLSQLRKTESMAEEETTKAEKSMNRAWSAVEKANQVVEERRRAIQEKINARDKRLADLAARKAREKLEKEEQIQSHFDFVKKRQEMKKKQDVERLTQVEQQLAVKDRMIDEQINRANQERIAKTTEMSERRNNKSRQTR
eukprot:CAMPEP_0206371460 /NCGR_PEP_ID=MMETSP0294-20121207/6492_1 /ASSEMBLY_ACC=CAM_ASM_000327 /TAXON_ID=39354 /ORGANISM="Heterosigma akashiwo, Strain CCMP2393" /LENGTH=323 /DNA_ID=CAMNT_0053818583 /DNA_START=38 /DNA_END=1007 /DNA_ORIENTATION=-